jgi:hypothetical protein
MMEAQGVVVGISGAFGAIDLLAAPQAALPIRRWSAQP